MQNLREDQLVGLASLETATALLRRRRNAHPTAGLYETADLHWWWSVPRRTDSLGQLFWFDSQGRPEAALLMADFSDGSSALFDEVTICPLFLPDPGPEQVAHVVSRGLASAREYGFSSVELEVDQSDGVMHDVLAGLGFSVKEGDFLTETWMHAGARSEVSVLHEDYRLTSRAETVTRPHHINEQNAAFVEGRLLDSSLYRPEFDLVVVDGNDSYMAYGLFWFDAETATGVVEPMRTKDEHQRRGLARHILTAGVDMLAQVGAERISISYEPANLASSSLYLSVGFEPVTNTDLLSGPT